MLTKETVLAALKKARPLQARRARRSPRGRAPALTAHLKPLLDSGEVKATGATMSRRIALPDQKFDEASTPTPPQRKQQSRKPKSGRKTKPAPHAAPLGRARGARRALHPDGRRAVSAWSSSTAASRSSSPTNKPRRSPTLLLQHYKA
jgi:hypothetical protein